VTRSAEAWIRWIERWPTVEGLAAAPLAEVLVVWQGLGYPRRARDLDRSARDPRVTAALESKLV
jgi:A/G-specific adenine glycosylase